MEQGDHREVLAQISVTTESTLPYPPRRGRRLTSTVAVVLALLVTACGSSKPSTGTIQGRLGTYGGLTLTAQLKPFSGHVRATDAKGKTFVVSVPADGTFVLDVPAGRYSLTGASPQYESGQFLCLGKAVTVSRARTANDDVTCEEK
jgi:hypothetical protein